MPEFLVLLQSERLWVVRLVGWERQGLGAALSVVLPSPSTLARVRVSASSGGGFVRGSGGTGWLSGWGERTGIPSYHGISMVRSMCLLFLRGMGRPLRIGFFSANAACNRAVPGLFCFLTGL